ncbi:hypothetical protein ES288_A11G358900v1 [Gossypium darwinii]|uniref:non-specific serine/threonine protein kinase n=1 Tax=Gossypium darwinii TaxID=34276 RepID=A0A5D2EU48_GOSDA|nr:hypothetical protein ES288_A11G358900v1 [Gossypium darwinii]
MPKYGIIELSKHVIHYVDGLPLALEVLGSFLCGRDIVEWISAIKRLEQDSNKEILDTLRISFDGLEEREKNIFLDIACFFNGEEKDLVMKVLDGCEFFPDIGIDVLIKKSLIKVSDDNRYLHMHTLVQEMGRKIVEERCINELRKRCRLWKERDVHHVLTKNTATEVIEGMIINNKRDLSNNKLEGDIPVNGSFSLFTPISFANNRLNNPPPAPPPPITPTAPIPSERPESQAPLDWAVRKRIALGAARGLAYFHDHCDPKIIHRDVKAANILLDEEFEAVVGDFGLAKLMDYKDTHVTTAVRGTIGHIAPEYLSTGKSLEKTDVFGYGVMLLELITRQRAFDLARLANDDDVMQPLPLRDAQDLIRFLHQPVYHSQRFKLWLSYFEIYGGKLFDLLSDRK